MTNLQPPPRTPAVEPPTPISDAPPPVVSVPAARRRIPIWAWVVIGLIAVVVFVLLSPIFALVSLTILVTAIVALSKRTPTWLRLRTRKAATVVTAASAIAFLVTGSISAAAFSSGPVDTASVGSAALVVPAAKTPVSTTSPRPAQTAKPAPAAVSYHGTTAPMSAAALLATLPVKGRAPMTGYARTTDFGTAWLDVDRNGCDTRNDILARDLTRITTSGSCKVLTGSLTDPYTGSTLAFTRGQKTSTLVQIDHMVALGDAWRTGAQQLTVDQRKKLANDPLNLAAVGQRVNEQKSDGDAATWLPPSKSYRCTYVARQVSVKAAYGLWVTPAEHDAIARILTSCPSQPAYTSTLQPLSKRPAKTAAPVATPSKTAAPVATPSKAASPAPAPKPTQNVVVPSTPKVVHPGSFCSAEGATGVTSSGTPMVCKTTATDSRARWRRA